MSQRILLIQLKRIGDCILTAPAIQEWRSSHPGAHISLLVTAQCAGIAQRMAVDEVIRYDSSTGWGLRAWEQVYSQHWDASYDFTGTDRSALLTWISNATHRHGYARFCSDSLRRYAYTTLSPASVRELHTIDFHRSLLQLPPGSTPGTDSLHWDAPPPALSLPPRYAVVHIGTAREEKFWPADRWATVLTHLYHQHQLPLVLTGTGTGLEAPHLDTLRSQLSVPYQDLTGQLSLSATASLITHATLALGVDSMAMHLAALAQVPQIVLFGPTNPFHWRPLSPRAAVLTPQGLTTDFHSRAPGGSMSDIPTQRVIEALNPILHHI
jgi:ADP-heptose:LPS heptosyltransferase